MIDNRKNWIPRNAQFGIYSDLWALIAIICLCLVLMLPAWVNAGSAAAVVQCQRSLYDHHVIANYLGADAANTKESLAAIARTQEFPPERLEKILALIEEASPDAQEWLSRHMRDCMIKHHQ